MNTTLKKLKAGFQSSSGTTLEFKSFATSFKNDFKKELKSVGATDIKFSVGHFYISGFYTLEGQAYYFSISDVRFFPEERLLYRTAKDYKDFSGGTNRYVKIETGMAKKMHAPMFQVI